MIGYFLAVLPVLFFFSDPILQLFSPSYSQIRRAPRPELNQLNPDLLALETNDDGSKPNYTCPPDPYTVHVFSRAPLVLYIENFLSAAERAHLLNIR
jgi:prolyl 4-hydroxylase